MKETVKDIDHLLRTFSKGVKKTVPYNDLTAEFYGGPMKHMITTGYEKGLRNLWKAEVAVPEFGFHDACDKDTLPPEAVKEIKEAMNLVDSPTFDQEICSMSREERRALARILSVILHGEAYALWVSSSLISGVRGTGSRMALAMQVMEEAKHFLVLREAVKKIDRIHPQSFAERLLLERIAAADPVNRLFGMNVILEGIALNFFQDFDRFPGLGKILHLFHMDEARHVALPHNYSEHLTDWEKYSPVRMTQRILLALPLLAVLIDLEDDAKLLGIDIFQFGANIVEKILSVAERSGFYTAALPADIGKVYNLFSAVYHKTQGEQVFEYYRSNDDSPTAKPRKIQEKILAPISNPLYNLAISVLK
jgi:hypothetical protein